MNRCHLNACNLAQFVSQGDPIEEVINTCVPCMMIFYVISLLQPITEGQSTKPKRVQLIRPSDATEGGHKPQSNL